MKTLKKIVLLGLMLALVLQTAALAQTDAAAVSADPSYTNEQILTKAYEMETQAQADDQAMERAFPDSRVFARRLQAQANHIRQLEALFAAYGFTLPEVTAANDIAQTQDQAYLDIAARKMQNIEQYKAFLSLSDLPDDLKLTLTGLMRAAQNHLKAGLRQLERAAGLGRGQQNSKNRAAAPDDRAPSVNGQAGKRGENRRDQFDARPDGGRFTRPMRPQGGGRMTGPRCPCCPYAAQTPAADPLPDSSPAPESGAPGS